jgi:hypothetical protein
LKVVGKHKPLRVAVGEHDNRRSNLWRIAARRNDVYVSTGGAAPAKFSFHESGICRDAFIGEFGVPPGMTDRAMTKWRRAEIAPANSGKACSVLEIAIPTDFLSARLDVPPKEISWVDAAPSGWSKSIEMLFSADSPEVAEPLILSGHRRPIGGFRLDNGSWFYVTSHDIAFTGQKMRIPAAGNRRFDFLITREEIPSSTRSTRVLVMSTPGDDDKMVAWEYGAFKCETGADFAVDGTLTPQRIFNSTSWEADNQLQDRARR